MKKFEVLVEDEKAEELTSLLKTLSFVKHIKESQEPINPFTLASEKSFNENWLLQ